MTATPAPVVDADGHILEPPDLWEQYLEPEYRDRAIRVEYDENGLEILIFDDQIVELHRGTMGALGGVTAEDPEEKLALLTPGQRTYRDGWAPGSNDPDERLLVMDRDGFDISLLYPTIGLYWEGWIQEPALATAYARAYNRWIADFCKTDPKRLKGAAHLSLLDPEGACIEAARARADGCIGVMLSPDPIARNGRMLSDPSFDRFWAVLQDLDMPMSFHVVARPPEQRLLEDWAGPGSRQQAIDPGLSMMKATFISLNVMAAFTQMVTVGVFEKFPRLKCGVLEAGATWIVAWLDRMDAKFKLSQGASPIKLLPSEYFYRQCVVSADPDERMIADCVRLLGADYFIWASDYPHIDASLNVLTELRQNIQSLSEDERSKVLGGTAINFYKLT
jgi:predicted TIM-barrel fold metal-dependent hydrolase